MIKQGGGGCIINITSVHEDWPMPGNTPYCLSKGGMRMDVALQAFVDGGEDAAFGDATLSWPRIDAARTDRRLKPRRFAQRQGSAASSLLQGSQLEHIAMPRRVVDVEAILGEIAAGAVVDLCAH